MRFDVERTLALVETWPSPRLEGSEAERRAADQLGTHLERAGLSVERIEVQWFQGARLAMSMIACFNMGLVAAMAQPGVSRWLRAGSLATAWASLIAAFWLTSRRASAAGANSNRWYHVIGRPMSKSGAQVRVVLVTRLDSAAVLTATGILSFGLVLAFALLPCLSLTPWYEREARLVPALGRSIFLTEWFLALAIVVLWPPLSSRALRPGGDDNRSGLGLLVELALNRIGSASETVETWFVGTSCELALPEELRRRVPRSAPVLVLWLHASGVGDEVVVSGRGPALRCARQAACDLWIPHQVKVALSLSSALMSRIYRKNKITHIRLHGTPDDRPANPALLAATAQLATEIALRWAKQTAAGKPPGSTDPEL